MLDEWLDFDFFDSYFKRSKKKADIMTTNVRDEMWWALAWHNDPDSKFPHQTQAWNVEVLKRSIFITEKH